MVVVVAVVVAVFHSLLRDHHRFHLPLILRHPLRGVAEELAWS